MLENVSIEQQIAQLEQQLQEKRASLEYHKHNDQETLPSDKEVLHEMIGQKIHQHAPNYTPTKPVQPPSQVSDAPSYLNQELKNKIQELVNIVFTKSLEDGIKEAAGSNNPALIDAFHDVLVDELYKALVERKKIKPVK